MTPLPDESGPGESIRHAHAKNAVGEGPRYVELQLLQSVQRIFFFRDVSDMSFCFSAMELDRLVHDVSIEASAVSIPLLRMGDNRLPSPML